MLCSKTPSLSWSLHRIRWLVVGTTDSLFVATPAVIAGAVVVPNSCVYRDCPALVCSLLQQLQGELQSGTFDLKAAGAVTETLTLDGAALVQHVATTPAASVGMGLKAGLCHSTLPSSMRAPPSVLATVAQPRASSMASCLKAPAAAGAAAIAAAGQEHHVVRAVTFAADVHDNGVDVAPHGHSNRAGMLAWIAHHMRAGASLNMQRMHWGIVSWVVGTDRSSRAHAPYEQRRQCAYV